jgi:hypothetical protein
MHEQLKTAREHLNFAGEKLNELGAPRPAANDQPPADPGNPDAPDTEPADANPTEGPRTTMAREPKSAAEALRQVADLLRAACNCEKPGSLAGQKPADGRGSEGQSEGSGSPGSGNRGPSDLSELEVQLGEVSERDWGRLPGTLRTEIVESSQRRARGDYARLIRRYFDEISKARVPELDQPPTGDAP